MKIVHLTDIHWSRKTEVEATKALFHVLEYAENNEPDLFVLTGDLFDSAIQNSERDGLPELLAYIKHLLKIAPIVAIPGTPTHDYPGCYAPLQELAGFTLKTNPMDLLFFDPHNREVYPRSLKPCSTNDLLILGCGEPSKGWFLRDKEGIGKEEATEAVSEGMKALLLGMAATRREYAENPCIFLYHGSVSGAIMGNGQTVPGTEIRVGRDELAAIGADYYALGHIHLRQAIDGLEEAWYGGSAFPVDWSERDQKAFNIVTIEGPGAVVIDHENYPFPPRMKIEAECCFNTLSDEYELDTELDAESLKGRQVWLNIRVSPTYDNEVIKEYFQDDLDRIGVDLGSRVTTQIIPIETPRAKEISEISALSEKVKLWADLSDVEIQGSGILEKADETEKELKKIGLAQEYGPVIRINKLILTGAIGIWKGLDRDTIDIDLDAYDPGIVGLVGPNGAGKTTILENMHPYPQMHTRSGKLQDHFRLQKSARDLYFTDERTGDRYRALILINGAAASGSCEYHLYKNNVPLVNGRLADYEQKIAEIFGPIELFLRSAFVMQKATKQVPELNDATPKEKKVLFTTLAGIDYLEHYVTFASENAKTWEARQLDTEKELEILAAKVEQKDELEHERARLEKEIGQYAELAGERQKEVEERDTQIAELRRQQEQQRQAAERKAELLDRLGKIDGEIDAIDTEIDRLSGLAKSIDEIEEQRRKRDELKKKVEALVEDQVAFHEEQSAIRQEYDTKRKAYDDEINKLDTEIRQVNGEIAALATSVSKLDRENATLTVKVSHKAKCPNCQHIFTLATDAEQSRFKEVARDLGTASELLIRRKEILQKLEIGKQSGIEKRPSVPDFNGWPKAAELRTTKDMLAAFEGVDERYEQARNASTEAGSLAKQAMALRAEREEISLKLAAIPEYTPVDDELAEAERLRDNAQRERDQYRTYRDQAEGKLTQIDAQLEELGEAQKQIAVLGDRLTKEGNEAYEWDLLASACGRDGIQALELDAVAPSITAQANEFLTAAYGPRFAIEIRTQRVSGSGARTKMIEAFDIIVHDAKTKTEQPYDTLSGGESVWVKKAIYDSFGVIRAKNTGVQFNTVFLDEADGALHPEAREEYLKLVQAAHEKSGRAHTIIITHSPELQQMIPQTIELR